MPNPYDDLLQQDTAERARTTMMSAVDHQPDTEAKLQGLAKQYGMPVDAVRLRQPEVEKRARLDALDYDTLAKQYPMTAGRLTDPAFAAVAHDDVDNMSQFERKLKQFGGGAVEGLGGMVSGFGVGLDIAQRNIMGAMVDMLPTPRGGDMTPEAAQSAVGPLMGADWRYAGGQAKALARDSIMIPSQQQTFADKVAAGLGQVGAQIPASVLLGAAPLYLQGLDAMDEKVGKDNASQGAKDLAILGGAAVTGITEKWALDKLLGPVATPMKGALSSALIRIGVAGASEGAQEATENLAQDLLRQALTNPDAPIQLGEAMEAGSVGAAVGAIVRTVVESGLHIRARGARGEQAAQAAEANGQVMADVVKLAEASKLRERSPENFATFAQSLAEGGVENLHIEAKTLMQSPQFEAIAQALPSVAEQIQEAAVRGGDIVVPTQEFLSAVPGSEFAQELVDLARTSEDAMSPAEARTFMQERGTQLQAQIEEAVAAQQESDTWRQSRDQLQADFVTQLNTVKRFTPDANEQYASLMANFYAVQASRLGTTPQELAQRYGLVTRADGVAGGRKLDQSGDQSIGPFGQVFEQFKGDAQGAIAHLRQAQGGEAVGALNHPELGDIDLVWGEEGTNQHDGYGLAKLIRWHPEVVDNLQEIVASMPVVKRSANRAMLESTDHKGGVRLQWDGVRKHWLLTAFRKEEGRGGGAPRTDTSTEDLQDGSLSGHPSDASVEQALKTFYQSARGSISLPDDLTSSPAIISLFKGADLSTFIHESGHFFLEVQMDLAARIQAQIDAGASVTDGERGIVEDARKILDWFDVKGGDGIDPLTEWGGLDLEAKRPMHEQWARGFEAYSFEGNAPSIELQGAFQKFRTWLVSIYKNLKALNVELTDDVRGVMDRMLASEQAIEEAQTVRAMGPLFKTADAAGMTPDEFAAYHAAGGQATQEAVDYLQARGLRDMKWLANAKNRKLKELQKQAEDLRKEVRIEARAEVMSQPVYRAWQFFKGNDPEVSGKLSRAALDEMFGGTVDDGSRDKYALLDWKRLSDQRMTSADGMHPDMVSGDLCFPSGEEMVRAMVAAEKPEVAIDALTDQLMLQRHGDLVTPEALSEAVDIAIHNDAQIRFAATGYAALEIGSKVRTNGSNGRSTVDVLITAARQHAQRVIGGTRVRDLRPSQFSAAAARAAKASQKAVKQGDTTQALTEQRNNVINLQMTKAALDAKQEMADIRRTWSEFANRSDAKLGKGYDMDVVNAYRAIVAQYGVAEHKGKRASEYLETVQGHDPEMAAALMPQVMDAERNAKPFSDLTVEEARGLAESLEAMRFLAKRSRQSEVDGNLLDTQDIVDELKGRIDEIGLPENRPGEFSAITPEEAAMAKFQTAIACARRVESWVGSMDGQADMGPFRRFIWNGVKDAADAYRSDKAKYLKRYRDLLEAIAPTMKRGLVHAPELGGYTFGKDSGGSAVNEILHAILHTGNESNKRKLLLGRGWANLREDGSVDTTQWDRFIQRMATEGKITKGHMDFVQGVWDLLEDTKAGAQKAHRQVFGKYFDEITANELVTPWGVYRGGYVPAKADPRVVKDAKMRSLMEQENASMAFSFPSTPKGFTKGRVEYNRPLMLDLRTLAQHIDQVLLFTHMEAPVRDVTRVIGKVGGKLDQLNAGSLEGMLTPWLNRSARQQVITPISGDAGLSRIATVLRSRAGAAAMFANLINALQQISGFALASIKVRPKLMLAATADFAKNPRKFARAVAEASPYMANRMDNEVAAMSDQINEILLNPSKLAKAQDWTMRHAYFMQSALDNTMSPIIWTAAYNQAIEGGHNHRDAVRLADSAVRETQGSTLAEDISRIETGNAWVRLFTQFIGYFNMQANLLGTEFVKVIRGEYGLRGGAARGLYVFMLGFMAPAVIAEAIVQAFRGGPDDEDDDGEWIDDWLAALFFYAPMRNATAMVPFVGQGINAVVNAANDKPYDDRLATSPAISMLESAARAPVSVYKAVADDGSSQKAVRDVGTLLSMTVGLPGNLAARPIGYAAGVADEKINPTGPVDAARGLVTGVASAESKR